MVDVVDKATRSRMMAGIRGRDTTPEMTVRRYLHAQGLRYRLHAKSLPGRPDLVFPRHRAVVFVNGCFWHRHPGCRYATLPRSNTAVWDAKFSDNMRRDALAVARLAAAGWRVFTVWECEIGEPALAALAARIRDRI
jgi:DNA mismatch endonuclease (patch repair protein)